MAYHTGIYLLLFLPAVLLLYQLTPKKSRWITLLAAGYLFSGYVVEDWCFIC